MRNYALYCFKFINNVKESDYMFTSISVVATMQCDAKLGCHSTQTINNTLIKKNNNNVNASSVVLSIIKSRS